MDVVVDDGDVAVANVELEVLGVVATNEIADVVALVEVDSAGLAIAELADVILMVAGVVRVIVEVVVGGVGL